MKILTCKRRVFLQNILFRSHIQIGDKDDRDNG